MIKKAIAAAALLAAVPVLAACGSGGGYAAAYVTGEAYCPGNPFATCVVMSDGDIVGPVGHGVLDDIVTGMILSPYSGAGSIGGYRFTRQPSSVTTVRYTKITSISSSTAYAGRTPVKPAEEVSEEKSGTTYAKGGPKYPHSPAYKTAQARLRASKTAAKAAAKANKQGYVRPGSTRSGGSKSSFRTSSRSRSGK